MMHKSMEPAISSLKVLIKHVKIETDLLLEKSMHCRMLFSTKYISNALIVLMSAKVFMNIRVAFYMITIIFEESNKDGKERNIITNFKYFKHYPDVDVDDISMKEDCC